MSLPAIHSNGRPSPRPVVCPGDTEESMATSQDSPRKRRQELEGYGSPKKPKARAESSSPQKAHASEVVQLKNAEQPQDARGRSPEPPRSLRKGLSPSPPTKDKRLSGVAKPPRTPGGQTPSKGNSSVSASKRSMQQALPPLPSSTQWGMQSPAPKHRKSSTSPMLKSTPTRASSSSRWSSSRKRRSSRAPLFSDPDNPESDPDLAKVLGFVALPNDVVDGFLNGLFLESATALNSAMQPVMDGSGLRFFLRKFFGPDERDAVEVGLTSYSNMGSNELAAHAGHLGVLEFRQVLSDIEKASPPGFVSRIISQRHFACCGDAALLVRTMKKLTGGPPESAMSSKDVVTWK